MIDASFALEILQWLVLGAIALRLILLERTVGGVQENLAALVQAVKRLVS